MVFLFAYRDNIWSTAFLVCESRLTYADRMSLVHQVCDMELDEKRRLMVKGEHFEGLAERGKYGLLGNIPGWQYDVKFDINPINNEFEGGDDVNTRTKGKVSFLVRKLDYNPVVN